MIILIAVPLLLSGFGIICAKGDKRELFVLAFALSVFTVAGLGSLGGMIGADAGRYRIIGSYISTVGFDSLGSLNASPAYLLILKICACITDEPTVFPLVIAGLQILLAVTAVSVSCREPYGGASVLMFCFIPACFAGSAPFTAALLAICASGYVRQRRFFRYAAVMIAAACFDTSALLLIPLYLIYIIPTALGAAAASAAVAALAVIFPDMLTDVLGFVGDERMTPVDVPAACAAIAAAAAIIAILLYAMLKNRDGHYEHLVPVLSCGAAFTAAAAFDARLFASALMLMMQSAVPLGQEIYEIGARFVEILLPGKKAAVRRVFTALCILACGGVCVYLTAGNVFGSDAYEAALETGVGLW